MQTVNEFPNAREVWWAITFSANGDWPGNKVQVKFDSATERDEYEPVREAIEAIKRGFVKAEKLRHRCGTRHSSNGICHALKNARDIGVI